MSQTSVDTCLECSGTGEIEEPIEGVNRPLISTCIACNGSGVVNARARLEGEIADG
jgi:DnaJ-class molecular chaperone